MPSPDGAGVDVVASAGAVGVAGTDGVETAIVGLATGGSISPTIVDNVSAALVESMFVEAGGALDVGSTVGVTVATGVDVWVGEAATVGIAVEVPAMVNVGEATGAVASVRRAGGAVVGEGDPATLGDDTPVAVGEVGEAVPSPGEALLPRGEMTGSVGVASADPEITLSPTTTP